MPERQKEIIKFALRYLLANLSEAEEYLSEAMEEAGHADDVSEEELQSLLEVI